jgi:exopolysaccharide biosynthesis polyprenyl glycosylphosphotransferase
VTAELFTLGMFEFAACFFAAIAAVAGGPLVADVAIFHFAATLAAFVVLTSIAVGSYRGDTFLLLRRIAFKTLLVILLAVAAGAAFVAIADGLPPLSDDVWRNALSRAAVTCLALLIAVRLVFGYAYRLGTFTRRLVVVGDAAEASRVAGAIERQGGKAFEIVGQFDLPPPSPGTSLGAGAALLRQCEARGIWGIVTASHEHGAAWRDAVRASGTKAISRADLWERYLHRLSLDDLAASKGRDMVKGGRAGGVSALLHRLADIVLSLGLLTFTLPLMVITALAIRLEGPFNGGGPILYRQERVGLRGQPFTLYKFRSMRNDAEASGPVWAARRDNRVTRIGQFIRLTRIDELPQLFNILRGEMSFIGPRPERPHFVAQLVEAIPFYADRAQVKPGLTGWAQVNYPYGASVEDARMKLSYDLYYVKHQNIYLDIIILFSTIRVILFQEGAR